jgi:hypothetical protein
MSKHRRYQLGALLLVLLSAVIRLPMERAITSDFRQQELLPERLDTNLRDQMTQESFAAAAGGLRSLLASYYELDAFSYFLQDPPRWDMIDKQYSLCCQLQPRVWHYWEMHTWMLAVNAAEYYATDGGSVKGLEGEMRRYYRQQGLNVCYRGIQHNPEKYRSYRQAADILANPNPLINPNPDFEEAAALYLQASKCADAQRPPAYSTRMLYRSHVYCLARTPHRAAEAYHKLRTLFETGPQEDFPTTRTLLRQLEDTLRIPAAERCLFK